MKILIADSFPESHQSKLEALGHSITVDPSLDGDTLKDAIGDNQVLIVRSTRVDRAILDAASDLDLVIRAGAGTNTIDKAYAADLDIRVSNVPGANSLAVAELTMGLIIALDRNIADNDRELKQGVWNKKKFSKARGIHGRSIGILGVGAIGMAVAERASAFGMNVRAIDKPGRSAESTARMERAGIELLADLDSLLETCDVVSLHMPASEETTNLVNTKFLDKMQDHAILINTSRGELVDEAALITAMDTKGIRAGLDVYQNEPGAADNVMDSDLARHPNVYGTHHIGASTEQAQIAVADGVLEVIASLEDGDLVNCVN